MKKTMVMLFMVCLGAGVFAQTGVLQELNGTVELKPAGAGAFVAAKEGDTIALNTIVSTGFKSTARVAIGNSVLTVRPLTRLSLAQLQTGASGETVNIRLQTGRIRAEVRAPQGTRTNFSVQSPTATASVRGTDFSFDTQNLNVSEGTVAFQGAKGMVMLVGAGSTSRVEANGKAADPIQTSAAAVMPPVPAGAGSIAGSSTKPTIMPGGMGMGVRYPAIIPATVGTGNAMADRP